MANAPDDQERLLTSACSGDVHALEILLFRRYESLLRIVASKIPASLQSLLDPEDILQQTFTVARKEIHLAGVCENGEVCLYVDGKVQTGRARAQGKVEASAYPLMFRAQPESLVLFRGMVDEVRFSSTARYGDDSPPTRRLKPDEKTVFLFSFDEGIGDFIADSVVHRFVGVVKGARWLHR